MRVLVSGFEPFLDEKVNPTQELAHFVNSCNFHSLDPQLAQLDVRGIVLPVEFDQAFQRLEAERNLFRPEAVISFGLAGGRSTFDVEMLAVNERGGDQTVRGDNRGRVLSGAILPAAPRVLPTTLPVEKILSLMAESKIPSGKSYFAGTYVCNDLFFQLQERLRFTRVRSGFLHVPRLQSDRENWPQFEGALLAILRSLL